MKVKTLALFIFLLLVPQVEAQNIATIKRLGLIIHYKIKNSELRQIEIKAENKHFVSNRNENLWTFSKIEKNQQISMQSRSGQLFYFTQKNEKMFFGENESDLICEDQSSFSELRTVASVMAETTFESSKCKNRDLAKEITKKN